MDEDVLVVRVPIIVFADLGERRHLRDGLEWDLRFGRALGRLNARGGVLLDSGSDDGERCGRVCV